MGNINALLRGSDPPVERRRRNRRIMNDFWDKWKKIPFLDVSDMRLVFNVNGIDVGRTTICSWLRKKEFFGEKGVKKKGKKWLCTKKSIERFLKRLEDLDMERSVEINKKPRRPRQSGIVSKRYASLIARGVISDRYGRR